MKNFGFSQPNLPYFIRKEMYVASTQLIRNQIFRKENFILLVVRVNYSDINSFNYPKSFLKHLTMEYPQESYISL